MKKVAIMQPYFFPYIGYFQLVNAVDTFVFYDDVQFIKNGWINRNKILINGAEHFVTVPCRDVSSFKLINEIKHDLNDKATNKLLKKIRLSYQKAPWFGSVFPIIEKVVNLDSEYVADLAVASIQACTEYLGIETEFKKSSVDFSIVNDLNRVDRVIQITKRLEGEVYINAINGKELYDSDSFLNEGIDLKFLNPELPIYPHFSGTAEPGLSILDVMMFNSPKQIREYLANFTLE